MSGTYPTPTFNWATLGGNATANLQAVPLQQVQSMILPRYNLTAAVNGGSMTIPGNCTWQLFTQTAPIATYTTIMPSAPTDGQDMILSTRGSIIAWTLTPNTGQGLDAIPTTLPVSTAVWYRWLAPIGVWVRLL